MFAFRWWHWFLIACIDIIGPFSTDSYIPNLPAMARELDAPPWLAGLTLQANWLAKGAATLVIGKLADSRAVGRRGALLGAFVFYVAGTVGCSLVGRDRRGGYALVACRVVQGFGEAATTVTSAVARDVLHDVDERTKMLALLGSLRPIAIVAAPSVGGLAGAALGWRYVFRGLAAWGALLFLGTALILPETRPRDDAPPGGAAREKAGFSAVVGRLRRGVAAGAHDERLAAAALAYVTLGMAGVLSFLSTIAPLLEERFALGTVEAAALIGSLPAVIIGTNAALAALISRRQRAGQRPPRPARVIRCALAIMALVAAAAVACAVGPRAPLRTRWPYLYATILLYNLGESLGMGPCMAAYLQPFADAAGVASALQITLRTAVGVAASAAVTAAVAASGVRALFLALAAAALGMQACWGLLPPPAVAPVPSPSGSYVSLADAAENADAPAAA